MNYYGYCKIKGKKYFMGQGNTMRTARTVAEGNRFLAQLEGASPGPVYYTKEDITGLPGIKELIDSLPPADNGMIEIQFR